MCFLFFFCFVILCFYFFHCVPQIKSNQIKSNHQLYYSKTERYELQHWHAGQRYIHHARPCVRIRDKLILHIKHSPGHSVYYCAPFSTPSDPYSDSDLVSVCPSCSNVSCRSTAVVTIPSLRPVIQGVPRRRISASVINAIAMSDLWRHQHNENADASVCTDAQASDCASALLG